MWVASHVNTTPQLHLQNPQKHMGCDNLIRYTHQDTLCILKQGWALGLALSFFLFQTVKLSTNTPNSVGYILGALRSVLNATSSTGSPIVQMGQNHC